MYAVLCILYCVSKTSTWGRAVSCVCVHLAAITVYAVWLDALLPLQFPYNTRKKETETSPTESICACLRICINWGAYPSFLTLDVYLLHFIDLCNCLSELLCKLPELFSTRGAETHQLLLLWRKRAQHGDAMGIVWWENQRERVFTATLFLKEMDFSKTPLRILVEVLTLDSIVAKNTCKPMFWG